MDRVKSMRVPHGWLTAVGALCLAATGLVPPAPAAAAPPAKGSSEPTAASGVRRDGHHTAIALADGKVLVAGGGEPAQVFDPATNTWKPTGPMAEKRTNHTATLLADGKVLVVGGVGDAGPLTSAELFDPATATWAPTLAAFDMAVKELVETAEARAKAVLERRRPQLEAMADKLDQDETLEGSLLQSLLAKVEVEADLFALVPAATTNGNSQPRPRRAAAPRPSR